MLAFALTLASAISWATGNVLVKRLPKVNTLHLMVWASLVPPLPAFAISAVLDGPTALFTAVAHASWLGLLAPLYLGVLASVFAYGIWGNLLQRYSTGAVAPFALLAPAVGAIASAFITGESFGPVRLAGMGCMLLGLAIVVLPPYVLGAVFGRPRGLPVRSAAGSGDWFPLGSAVGTQRSKSGVGKAFDPPETDPIMPNLESRLKSRNADDSK